MIYSGNKSIKFLASQIDNLDVGESSHWRKHHEDFKFTGDGFEGLLGFGGRGKRNFILNTVHRLLQSRFRKLGKCFSSFAFIDRVANKITLKQNRNYDMDVLRQSLTISFIKETLSDELNSKTTCVIGDGFASMTSLLLASGNAERVILVNLTKTLLVDLWYLKKSLGEDIFESSVDLVHDKDGLMAAMAKPTTGVNGVSRVIAIQAENHQLIRQCPIDLVINVASMQEMDPPVIQEYFNDIRAIASEQKLYFYCCNREEKILPDGEVTRFYDYPWLESDTIIVDELCPWHQELYNLGLPLYSLYDGPHLHRLIRLS
ncbi:putative sugar O-methyltransferase [Oceanospirillaceae bacterium]|nr:putative sugar O-methyltransferase [Oceanospirillaceae bacterium]